MVLVINVILVVIIYRAFAAYQSLSKACRSGSFPIRQAQLWQSFQTTQSWDHGQQPRSCVPVALSFPQPPTPALTTTPVLFSDTHSCSCLRSSALRVPLPGRVLPAHQMSSFLLRAGSQGRFVPPILCELTPLFCSWHFSLHLISCCLSHSLTSLLGLQAHAGRDFYVSCSPCVSL